MAFCQLGSAQFSLSNWACTDLLTLEGSPWASATVDSTGLPAPDAGALDNGEGEALDAGDGLADGEGLDDGESFAEPAGPQGLGLPAGLGRGLRRRRGLRLPLAAGAGRGGRGGRGRRRVAGAREGGVRRQQQDLPEPQLGGGPDQVHDIV